MFRNFLLLFLLLSDAPESPPLAIDLAVEWKTERVFIKPLNQFDFVAVPYLKVTYNNLSENHIYFKRPVPLETYLPNVFASMINTPKQLDEQVLLSHSDSLATYRYYLDYFHAIHDTSSEEGEIELPLVNDYLYNLYTALTLQEKLNDLGSNKQLSCFAYEGKQLIPYREATLLGFRKESEIKKEERAFNPISHPEQFVFLEPGEQEVQTISLLAFTLAKGVYTFGFSEPLVSDSAWVETERSGLPEKVKLPLQSGKFKLYQGKVLGNSLCIDFD